MNVWEVCAVILLAAMLPGIAVCVRAGAGDALVAIEVLSTVAVSVLMILAEDFHRQPLIDVALILAVISLVGSFAFARLMEQDL